jgi:hypothetical protein
VVLIEDMRRALVSIYTLLCIAGLVFGSEADRRLAGAFRRPTQNGWVYVHVEGSPATLGFQHGYLLAREIEDNKKAIELSVSHGTGKSWAELRSVTETLFWPKVPIEYRVEIQGIAKGAQAQHVALDAIDIAAMNAYMEFDYYFNEVKRREGAKVGKSVAEHCSAFVATGSYTKDGKIVVGHNNWTDYLTASRWNIVFDVVPSAGHHFLMDGMPGLIHSADDFGVNDAGLIITETTIANFHGFDEKGIPEFARARKAMQYAGSISEFEQIMKEGNNGGYANAWLVGDLKSNEIARLELGLKVVTLERSKDGYFVGANFPVNPKLAQEETDYPASDPNAPNTVRHRRWDQLMSENKGKIDIAVGEKFETDHYDAVTHEIDPNERTICGHIDKSSRGLPGWQGPFAPAGVAQVKVTDAQLASRLAFVAGMGHPCGLEFHADAHLEQHPEYGWQRPMLRDLKANTWTTFSAVEARTGVAAGSPGR